MSERLWCFDPKRGVLVEPVRRQVLDSSWIGDESGGDSNWIGDESGGALPGEITKPDFSDGIPRSAFFTPDSASDFIRGK